MDGIRPRPPRSRGRHLLAPRVASDLVRNAGICRADHVVEIGAGVGAITCELARRAGRVDAVENDREFASALARRFARDARVRVIAADVLEHALPRRPFRVVGNVPFAHTTAILRKLLDDPAQPVLRADLIVEWGAAVKRCSQRPSTLLTTSWLPWFELTITRRIPRSSFRPAPRVDGAVVTITRRPDPLLDLRQRTSFVAFLEHAFARREDASDLDVWQWTRLYRRRRR